MAYASTNPYTNELLQTFPDATDDEVNAALDKAHAAFLGWSKTSFAERAAVLNRAAQLVRERKNELARLNTLEMGKLFAEPRTASVSWPRGRSRTWPGTRQRR